MIAVRLTADLEKRLDELARKTGRTKTFYVREAIVNYLDEIEDIYLAEKRLQSLVAEKSKTYTLEEVVKKLGLED
ncbi:MAG TPA: TraY domain-containing protein [Acidobacteriota bacterium]|nr:TraY domain-containing protein [Acidobacteriota bacterium]HNT18265.1 TraY domain-containing protein [Acidobacteriota bacterium]HPA28058.1 TraY domain-containing protein [Acidobacteriota bacterium]HQO20180.1 TraY domain-containing protein [Acidobacteriota bacterium]HQQ47507.1 TraY domain-containing protein [Acidobacteriota bacterium]